MTELTIFRSSRGARGAHGHPAVRTLDHLAVVLTLARCEVLTCGDHWIVRRPG